MQKIKDEMKDILNSACLTTCMEYLIEAVHKQICLKEEEMISLRLRIKSLLKKSLKNQ